MLTIKKRGHYTLAIVAAACLSLTACGPPGTRALHKGDQLIQDTNFEAAITVLSQAVNLLTNDPADVPARAAAFNLLGVAYHGAGNAPKAQQDYEQALALNRNLAAADFNLGCLEFEHTNLGSARDFLTTYTSLQKWNVDGYLKLGQVYLRLAAAAPSAADRTRQLDYAKKEFETAQNLSRTAEAGNDLGVIELLASPRPSAAAISNAVLKFNVALAADPTYSPALLNLAIVYDKYLNDGHRALLIYGKYMALDPPPPYSKEVIALTNGLDRTLRFQIHTASHTTGAPTASPEPSPGTVTVTPSKLSHPPPAANPIETNSTRPSAETSLGVTPSNPTPQSTSTTPVQEPPPSTPTPEPTQTTTVPAQVAATTPSPQPAPSVPPTAPKKSALAKINPLNWFGGKSAPTPSGAPAVNPNGTPVVTPLPDFDSRSAAHYTPTEVAITQGNRQEAVRLRAEGVIAEKASRLNDAEVSYQDAVKADPSYFEANLSLGLTAIRTEDFSIALDALHRAVTLNPDSADARYAYAWALEKRNYFLDAANELEKLLAQKPNELRAHLLLGNLYAEQLGQPDLARGHYEQVLDTDPKNPQAPALRAWLRSFPAH